MTMSHGRTRDSDVIVTSQNLTKFDNFCSLLTISAHQMTVEVIEQYGGIVHLRVVRYDYVTWSGT